MVINFLFLEGDNMDVIRFIYEHWVLTSWFIFLFSGGTFVKFIKKIKME